MIEIITRDNRRFHHHALMEMHRQRKAVFIDRMGWGLAARDGLEIDAYDSAAAIYLIKLAGAAKVECSARLLPTQAAHMMGDLFAGLCVQGVPQGPKVWEVSRFCPGPHVPKGAARQACFAEMIAAILETGLLFGIEKVSFVAHAALAPLARNVGWACEDLGPPARVGRERLTAMAAAVTPQGLAGVRLRNGVKAPITRYLSAAMAEAA